MALFRTRRSPRTRANGREAGATESNSLSVVPKLLRPYFLHRRELLGELCRAAWHSVAVLTAEAAGDDVLPGMVAAVHTGASDLRWRRISMRSPHEEAGIGRVHGTRCRGSTLTPPSLCSGTR